LIAGQEQPSRTRQRPDGTRKNTNRQLYQSVAHVRVDDDTTRSDYTIHVTHPTHDGGVRCFHRPNRELVVSGLKKHLASLPDDIVCVEIKDEAGLRLSKAEIQPDQFKKASSGESESSEVPPIGAAVASEAGQLLTNIAGDRI